MVAVSFLNPGELVGGKYAITRVIGSGGMAIVYEALHVRLDQRVALKMLLPDLLDRDDIVTRFDREARAAVRLRSPHVARVYDVDALPDGTPYMVMELLDGRDLAAELTLRGPLPVSDAVEYVLQACEAMAEAHQQGTVHRDLKPSNLFLTQERGRPFVKVLDFGVSKIAAERLELSVTTTRSALGTALYMSPEQVRSAKNVDPRTDVWSLGVVLYELLTARAPFAGESTTAVAAAIVADEPEPIGKLRPDLPPELTRVVMRALEKDRENRFVDAGAFAAVLAPFRACDEGKVAVSARRALPAKVEAEGGASPPTDNGQPSTAATMSSGDAAGAAIRADHALVDDQGVPRGEPASSLVGRSASANDQSAQPGTSAIRNPPPFGFFRSPIDASARGMTPADHAVAGPRFTSTDHAPHPRRARMRRGIAIAACVMALLGVATVVVQQGAHRDYSSGPPSESDPGSASAAVLVGVLPSPAQPRPGPEPEVPSAVADTAAVPAPSVVSPGQPSRPAPVSARPRAEAPSRPSAPPRPSPGGNRNGSTLPAAPAVTTPTAAAAPAASAPADAPRAPQPNPTKPPLKKRIGVDLPDTPG
jgi:serine/threonine-protein kinase